jgi:hypothetical protein
MNPTIDAKAQTNNTNTKSAPDFGNGRYSPVMAEMFKDIQRVFGLPAEKAEIIARQFGSDFGRALGNAPVKAAVSGKLSKNGELTLKEAAKVKVITTNSITLARLIVALDEARSFGLTHESTYVLSQTLREWIDGLRA